jgi:cephalosporin hydroxylase
MSRQFDGFKKTGSDSAIEDLIQQHCEKYEIDPLDAVKLFPVLARRQWLKRFLAHVELFKQTLEIPGDIAELGVFRGGGLMTWANLLEAYAIGDRTKVVYGFDNWRGFTELDPNDGKPVDSVQKSVGGFSPEAFLEELEDAIAIFDADRFIPWKPRVKLIKGDIEKTVGRFIEENSGIRFSFIHFDCDLYQPTKAALEAFWPVLSKGGIMIFDEYSIPDWPGETKAVDEFFADKPQVIIKTFPWTNTPAGYLVKP